MDQQVKGFIIACKDFFGFLPGQTLFEFKNEVAALTPKDRAEMLPGLEKALGYKISTETTKGA